MSPAAQRVEVALRKAGVAFGMCSFETPVPTAAAAAAALGCDLGAIANSLVFKADGRPLLVVASGSHRVDVGLLSQRLGAQRIRTASPAFVAAKTGQVVGGVAPVGHIEPIETVLDLALASYSLVWAGGGDEHTMVSLSFQALSSATGGLAMEVA